MFPPLHAHAPPEQASPAAHGLPHAPQFAVSDWVSTQLPLQSAKPAGHTHAPPVQVFPPPHAWPHAPQSSGSVDRSTQLCPHAENGGVQAPTHWLAWQNGADDGHTLPHAPQFCGSASSGRHTPPHRLVPSGHVHVPFVQVWPDPHATPQPPQSWGSVCGKTQPSAHASCPGVGHAHAPAEQVCPLEHATPQPPQFATSLDVSTQALSHDTRPAPQPAVGVGTGVVAAVGRGVGQTRVGTGRRRTEAVRAVVDARTPAALCEHDARDHAQGHQQPAKRRPHDASKLEQESRSDRYAT